jgi:hypothetical protein
MLRITALLLVLGIGGCNTRTTPSGSVLKIAVFADGRLAVDGSPASIPSLQTSLRQLSERKGVVWYYREAGRDAPPPIALEVMKAVVEARVPIRLSTRPDYSDSVGPPR